MTKDYLTMEETWFENHLEDLLKDHEGMWAVVFHQQLAGVFSTFDQAYREGLSITKSEKILVRQIKKDKGTEEASVNISLGLLDAPTFNP